jgi:predicted RNA binding protein YcfA (HicA-like mRNA interferase family)
MHHNFKQKLANKGWQFLRNGKGSHQLWQHPERGIISISVRAGRMQIARSVERKLFGL